MTKPITFDSSTGNLVTQKFKGSRKALLESLQTLRKKLAALGFRKGSVDLFGEEQLRPSNSRLGEERYIHPHGHTLRISSNSQLTGASRGLIPASYTMYFAHIPKEHREGLALTIEATEASKKTLQGQARTIAEEDNRWQLITPYAHAERLETKDARRAHEDLVKHHTREAGRAKDANLTRLHSDAAAAHGIARDWYMDKLGVQNRSWAKVS